MDVAVRDAVVPAAVPAVVRAVVPVAVPAVVLAFSVRVSLPIAFPAAAVVSRRRTCRSSLLAPELGAGRVFRSTNRAKNVDASAHRLGSGQDLQKVF